MKEEKESSFFKKAIISIKDFEKYPELASKKWTIVLSYLIKLLLILTIVISFIYVYQGSKEIKTIKKYIQDEIPNFTFNNNILKLQSENTIKKENLTDIINLIIIDTREVVGNENLEQYKSSLDNNESGVILLKDKAIIKTKVMSKSIEYSYSSFSQTYKINDFNKQNILQYFSDSNLIIFYIGIFIISFIYMFLINITSIWIDILLLAIFGYVSALFMKIRIRFVAMCKIAIHSLTLPILLNIIVILIETFTQFKIKYFEFMYIGIAYIYVITAVLMIKSDVIKNQQELTKIIEEQNKIKEEMKKQEEDKKQKEKEDKEEKEDKKKKKEKNNKENEEPQGNNA